MTIRTQFDNGGPHEPQSAREWGQTISSEVDRLETDKVDDDDARLSDARTPTAHAVSHGSAGSDPVTPAAIGAATSAQGSLADTAVQPEDLTTVDVNTQTASYTLVLADAGKVIEMDVATANNLTVPPNSAVAFPVGTVLEVYAYGAGATTIVAGAGVTVRTPDTLVLDGQYATVTLRKRATDEWTVDGRLVAA